MLGGKERAEQLNKEQKSKIDKRAEESAKMKASIDKFEKGYPYKEEISDIRKYYKPRRGDPDYNRGTGGRSKI